MSGVRETKKRATRKAILEAAVRLFGERGYERTSIEEIARAAGVGKGTIYGYFRTKDEIFLAFCEDEIDYAFAMVAEKSDPEAPLIEQLVTLFMSQFEVVTADREFGRVLQREMIFPDERTWQKSKGLSEKYQKNLGEILERAQQRGELKPDVDPLLSMGHFYGLYLIVLSSWFGGDIRSPEEAEVVLRAMLIQALNGLGAAEGLGSKEQSLLEQVKGRF